MRHGLAAICAAFSLLGGMSEAEDITLRFSDGSFEVSGPLLGFDGLSYRVASDYGPLTVSAQAVDCVAGCPEVDDVPRIRLAGSTSLSTVLMPALVDTFGISLGVTVENGRTDEGALLQTLVAPETGIIAVFETLGTTTAKGFDALAQGQVDIVLADRPAMAAEIDQLRAAELGDLSDPLRRRLIARQPIKIYGPQNRDTLSLTADQLRRVLSGDLGDWAGLGGAEGAISLHVLSSELSQIEGRLAALARVLETPSILRPVTQHQTPATLATALEQDRNALALTSRVLLVGQEASVNFGCEIADMSTSSGVDTHVDPLLNQFWAYTAAPRLSDLARAFLVFATGPQAQRTVDRAGFVDKRPDPISLADQGDRLARSVLAAQEGVGYDALRSAILALEGRQRLSVTFRFTPGTASLDPGSRSDIQSLAAFLDAGQFDGHDLLFTGFSDGIGGVFANQQLSQARAETVQEAVSDSMATNPERVQMAATGLGEVMPLACDNTAWGRHVNRRVEVWVTP